MKLVKQFVFFRGVQSGEIDKKLGEERMAWCYNGLGLTHYYQKQYIEVIEAFLKKNELIGILLRYFQVQIVYLCFL